MATVCRSRLAHSRCNSALTVGEGESAVFRPGDVGRSSLVARITVEEWQMLAQQG
jgi:hypothetical protein